MTAFEWLLAFFLLLHTAGLMYLGSWVAILARVVEKAAKGREEAENGS